MLCIIRAHNNINSSFGYGQYACVRTVAVKSRRSKKYNALVSRSNEAKGKRENMTKRESRIIRRGNRQSVRCIGIYCICQTCFRRCNFCAILLAVRHSDSNPSGRQDSDSGMSLLSVCCDENSASSDVYDAGLIA